MKKMRILGLAALGAVWLALTFGAWLGTSEDVSVSERRQLAQFPELTTGSVLSGAFMSDFEDYTLDQFPLRDTFRQLKAQISYNVLRQGDNNGIYFAEGFAAQVEYPLNESSVSNAVEIFDEIYETNLTESGNIVMAVVPDKGYYLAEQNGYPAMDYVALFETVREGTPWAAYVDITDCLSAGDYYFTDTHWRQEKITDVAEKLCKTLGAASFDVQELVPNKTDRPFYGVYHGQAALPMEAEDIYTLENDIISSCTVYNHETGKTTSVYDMDKLGSRDLYDVYLSGAAALLTIGNPNAASERELIVFRDSFGSSLVPLLLKGYKTVTVVDIRYIASEMLGQFVDFHGQDVLFLYSTLVLNNSSTLK